MRKKTFHNLICLITGGLILALGSGCNFPKNGEIILTGTPAIQMDATQIFEGMLASAQAELQPEIIASETPAPVAAEETETPIPTATKDPNRTPPQLPANFQSDLLNKRDIPHTYISDTCEFLKNRWSAGKAEPGTVVMVIMYHSIVNGDDSAVTLDNQISSEKQKQIISDLYNQGFEAIDMTQFINFMKTNELIPPRSVLLISDDRHFEEYFANYFLPAYQDYGWKVVNAWISADGTTQDLWDQNARIEAAGYVDHQAHGVVHNENMSDASPEEYLYSELQGSIDRIQQYFGKTPKAIIWPGGSFGYRPIAVAKELGYEVGFTVNPRGPVMYNWVPLDDEADPGRPSYLPDGMHDPLFVIPRYWSPDATEHIDTVRQIGKAAKESILANREIELEYYDIVCSSVTGEIPGL